MRLLSCVLAFLCLVAPILRAEEFDDCDANFIAAIGSSAYQFSPGHEGELGAVRLFSILSYQRAAHDGRSGEALWQLRIDRVADGVRVLTVDGRSRIGAEGATLAELWWDGRDERGALVPAGRYRYTFVARYEDDGPVNRDGRIVSLSQRRATTYDAAFDAEEALASVDEVVVDYALTPAAARNLRVSSQATSCQVQQNAPIESGFPYNFYYGSTHAHSNWSDGGHPTGACSSGNGYGTGTYAPVDVFDYARSVAGLDFWVVNEHNHLIQDAIANNNPPVTEAKVRQRYQDGLAAAAAASVDGSFVAMYGMEWGVSTNSDQGHVTLIETPQLFGWETCTNCNGPSPECTPGTNCYFDVFTPKRYGYLSLYAASVAHPSAAGPLGVFNHPGSGNFDGFAYNADAADAMQGIAVRSGLAFSTATDCANANVGSTDYSSRWREALNKGFRVGPVADHDSHCNNYGMALPTRTVYLAPALTRADILAAHRARRFYATEDPNVQLVFRTGDGAHVMGDAFTAPSGTALVAALYDPDGESVSTIEIWRGQAGAGVPTAPYATFSNQSSVTLNESLTAGTYWYYVRAIQPDGHDVWSSPMWITWSSGGGGGDTQAPTVALTAPAGGATLSGTAPVTASASDDVGVARVEFRLDGALAATDTTAPYEWSWNTTTATNGAHSLQARAFDAAGNSASSASVNVTVSNGSGGGGGADADVSGWTITQANASYTWSIPAGTVIPADGYLIVARQADKAAFESFRGVTLGANVVFINANGGMPVINGGETYVLTSSTGASVDGPTPALTAGQALQRVDPCSASWTAVGDAAANPGSGAGDGCAGGVKLNEIADASGTGNYVYEYLELYNDAGGAPADTEAPAIAIATPANGSTVAGSVAVSASATDNVGVASVEFRLGGNLVATDTTSPYAWTWDTTGSANGAHALTATAFDEAGNSAVSASVTVTVNNAIGVDVSGYRLVQSNSSLTWYVPSGIEIPSKGYVVIGRNATRAQFESYWGVTLGGNVVYVDAGDAMPQINGSEAFTLYNGGRTKLDGATVAMASSGGESLQRKNGCGSPGKAASWNRLASSAATPGSGAPAPCGKGVYISEFADALGTGNYVYEFIELHNDE